MATKKKVRVTTKVRANISRERQLALLLRAILDASSDNGPFDDALTDAINDGFKTMDALGYGSLVGIPKQIAALELQLTAAVTARDYQAIANLGKELARVKQGKSPKPSIAPTVKKLSSRKNGQLPTPIDITKIVNEEVVVGGEHGTI